MSHPFAKILLATEHTEFDAGAERLAMQMAIRCGLPLAGVLPVRSNPEFEAAAPELAERAEREAAAKLDELRNHAQRAGVELAISARHGQDPYIEIVDEAKRLQSDLIVLRRRGKQGFLARLLVGEMVSKVASHAPCNVLFVPRAGKMWSQGLLAGIDNSPNAEQVTRLALSIAKQCGLQLTLLSVVSHDVDSLRGQAQKTLERMAEIASGEGVRVELRVVVGKPFEQILQTAKSLAADLVIVGRHGESNLLRAPFGGTTQKVLGLAEGPVLVVHTGPAP